MSLHPCERSHLLDGRGHQEVLVLRNPGQRAVVLVPTQLVVHSSVDNGACQQKPRLILSMFQPTYGMMVTNRNIDVVGAHVL